jgi:hypothetical protein
MPCPGLVQRVGVGLPASRAGRVAGPSSLGTAPRRFSCCCHSSRATTLPQAGPAADGAAGCTAWWKFGAATLAAGTAGLAAASSIALADEAEHGLHAPAYPWPHDGFFRCAQAQRRALSLSVEGGRLRMRCRRLSPRSHRGRSRQQRTGGPVWGFKIARSGVEDCKRRPGQPKAQSFGP